MLKVRRATAGDLPAITGIYNEAVVKTTATFDTEPKSTGERRAWLAAHGPRHPVLVAEQDGSVVGWASLSEWSDRAAYADTAEVSVYVAESHRGQGIGRELLRALLAEAQEAGIHAAIGRVAEGNEASMRLLAHAGFEHVGTMREVGRKFGKLLDVCLMQKILNSPTELAGRHTR